jgi:8-oxo-dGTP pyrophosphatase MutT (NUDIX family)
MKPGKVRAIAICVFLHNGQLLAAESYDEVKRQNFYRPLGGTIEFGEYSQQTVVRELREEINAEVTNLQILGVLENVFTYNGQTGHEIVFVYQGEFLDSVYYDRPTIGGVENGTPQTAVWRPLNAFRTGEAILYPTGLLKLLDQLESEAIA